MHTTGKITCKFASGYYEIQRRGFLPPGGRGLALQEILEAALGANAAGLAIRRANQALKPGYWTVRKELIGQSTSPDH